METPILDFVRNYIEADTKRFHMPGHKGRGMLGCEKWDITEISGADALYEADGIIARSEENATALFGTGRTVYSTEGSSQCIRAMLYLAVMNRSTGGRPVVVAARNVHKAFVYAAALLDIEVVWLWPEERTSLCGCHISPEQLERTLQSLSEPPAAVYLTSPDYLGAMADISSLSGICHKNGTILIVDNAHGAYLKFLQPSRHPMDQGADLCCDSAHKTFPVLTGGAYLHIGKNAPSKMAEQVKGAMALFGSTSPSYLTLLSLDACNNVLAEDYQERLAEMTEVIDRVKERLSEKDWTIEPSDPLRITVRVPEGLSGHQLAQRLREQNIECEYSDEDYLVLMLTPNNDAKDLEDLTGVLGRAESPAKAPAILPEARGEQAVSVREALFTAHEVVPAEESLGRICGAPTVACPPAIPIVISGERISEEAVYLFRYYGIKEVDVLK